MFLDAINVTRHRQEGIRGGWQVSNIRIRKADDGIMGLVPSCATPQPRPQYDSGISADVLLSQLAEWTNAVSSVSQIEASQGKIQLP